MSTTLKSQCVFRYEPSTADVETFSAVQAPQAKTPNVLRWYNHIKSFTDKERAQFPKKKADFSAAPSASAAKPADDDDDVDLFGSDDEEVLNLYNFTFILCFGKFLFTYLYIIVSLCSLFNSVAIVLINYYFLLYLNYYKCAYHSFEKLVLGR